MMEFGAVPVVGRGGRIPGSDSRPAVAAKPNQSQGKGKKGRAWGPRTSSLARFLSLESAQAPQQTRALQLSTLQRNERRAPLQGRTSEPETERDRERERERERGVRGVANSFILDLSLVSDIVCGGYALSEVALRCMCVFERESLNAI